MIVFYCYMFEFVFVWLLLKNNFVFVIWFMGGDFEVEFVFIEGVFDDVFDDVCVWINVVIICIDCFDFDGVLCVVIWVVLLVFDSVLVVNNVVMVMKEV